jgi:hypothetical protein
MKEGRVVARISIVICIAALSLGSPSVAQEWAQEMFEKTDHDFGSVARSAKAEFEFRLTNLYADDVHIAAVYSSCGCTTPRVEKDTIKAYEKGAIVAHVNSDRFLGQNSATITVVFDKPEHAEVQLHIRVFIHGDVVLDPSSVMFGVLDQGSEAKKTVSLAYAGRSDWGITEVRSSCPHLSGKAVEAGRAGGRVSYALTARLAKTAPPGPIREHLILITNDLQAVHIPVLVEGEVAAPVSASPATLFFGVVAPGQTVTKSVVVRSKKPFHITAITAECPCLEARTPVEEQPKSLYIIPVTFTARQEPGKIAKSIRVKTDLVETAVTLSACAGVASP